MRFRSTLSRPLVVSAAIAAGAAAATTAHADETYPLFERVTLDWDEIIQDPTPRGPHVVRSEGQVLETTIRLPDHPTDQRLAQRIVAEVRVRPALVETDGRQCAGDPWPRIGSLSVVRGASGKEAEVELMRFATAFGGPGRFVQDITPLAPLLSGTCTLRLMISTFKNPGWEADAYLTYSTEAVGQRRPVLTAPLFNDQELTAEDPRLEATVDIPSGLAQPRIRLITTGHATDGTGGDEFVTRDHVLKIDGREVWRCRPWAERGCHVRDVNFHAGRQVIDGRVLWSSDLDRSGWTPGEVVEPMIIPAGELTPGRHRIELQVLGIDPRSGEHMGYWRISATVVADEPWPEGR
jgi:hypothetical protein